MRATVRVVTALDYRRAGSHARARRSRRVLDDRRSRRTRAGLPRLGVARSRASPRTGAAVLGARRSAPAPTSIRHVRPRSRSRPPTPSSRRGCARRPASCSTRCARAARITPAWVWWRDDRTVGAIARHQVQEAAVHRWDAQSAVGTPEPLAAVRRRRRRRRVRLDRAPAPRAGADHVRRHRLGPVVPGVRRAADRDGVGDGVGSRPVAVRARPGRRRAGRRRPRRARRVPPADRVAARIPGKAANRTTSNSRVSFFALGRLQGCAYPKRI